MDVAGGYAVADMNRTPGSAPGDFSHDLLAGVLECIMAGVCVWDSDLRLVTSNSSFRKIYRLPESLLRIGTPLREILD